MEQKSSYYNVNGPQVIGLESKSYKHWNSILLHFRPDFKDEEAEMKICGLCHLNGHPFTIISQFILIIINLLFQKVRSLHYDDKDEEVLDEG